MNATDTAIEAISEFQLRETLTGGDVDLKKQLRKCELVKLGKTL